jgi:hypothetical protein
MATLVQTAAVLTAFGHEPRPATATVIEQPPGARFGRVLGGLGMFWGLALVSVFVPVAHFLLVPTFAVAGIVMAVKRAREDRRLVLLRCTCPRCGAAHELRPGGRFVAGRRVDCPTCHGDLTLGVPSAR